MGIKIEIGQVWGCLHDKEDVRTITHFELKNNHLMAIGDNHSFGFCNVDLNHFASDSLTNNFELVSDAAPETIREPIGFVTSDPLPKCFVNLNEKKTMKFINDAMAKRWAEVKEKVKDDPRSSLIMNFSEQWAVAMESEMDSGHKLETVVLPTFKSVSAKFNGQITGEVVQASVSILIPCWLHGQELRKFLENQGDALGIPLVSPSCLNNTLPFESFITSNNDEKATYHVHVYGPKQGLFTKGPLVKLYTAIMKEPSLPNLSVGSIHEKPIGPHPKPQFTIEVNEDNFHAALRYLMLNRNGLSVLVHPKTGHSVKDHTKNCFWMGTPLKLDLGKL